MKKKIFLILILCLLCFTNNFVIAGQCSSIMSQKPHIQPTSPAHMELEAQDDLKAPSYFDSMPDELLRQILDDPSLSAKDVINFGIASRRVRHLVHKLDFSKLSDTQKENLTDKRFINIIKLFPNILEIDLNRCSNVTNKSIIALARICHNLTSISLYGCTLLTDNAIIALTQNRNLTSINLTWCEQLTSNAIIALTQNCRNLTSINLSFCDKLTDSAIIALAKNCRNLIFIKLLLCNQLTDAKIISLKRAFPNCEVISKDANEVFLPAE